MTSTNKVLVEGNAVSELVRNSLCPTIEKVVADGLLPGVDVWMVIRASATSGPATKSVHELVTDLTSEVGLELGEQSLQFQAFIGGLLSLHSLDCWLSYLALKDTLLAESYCASAFLRRASSSYRSQFQRLVLNIQPLSLLPFSLYLSAAGWVFPNNFKTNRAHNNANDTTETGKQQQRETGKHSRQKSPSKLPVPVPVPTLPTRLPSDSRVPKSSSIPARLAAPSADETGTPKSGSVDSGLARFVAEAKKGKSKIPVPLRLAGITNNQATSQSVVNPGIRPRDQVTDPEMPILSRQSTAGDSMMSVDSQSESVEYGRETTKNMVAIEQGNRGRFVSAMIDCEGDSSNGMLRCSEGETLEVVQEYPKHLKCKRCRNPLEQGLIRRSDVTFVTFL